MKRVYLWIFLAMVALYIALAVFLPADPVVLQRYQITETRAKILALSVAIPVALIHLIALYGFVRFKSYADSVKKTKEGPAFMKLADGLMVLAFGLPISGASSSILNYVARTTPDLTPTATILKNYISLIFPLIAIVLVAKGSSFLIKTLKRQESASWTTLGLLGTLFLSTMYTWLITTRTPLEQGKSTYYLPNWLIILTLAIPYLYLWCKGIRAVYQLYLYKSRVGGAVYRRALGYLAFGIGVIIGISVSIQILVTLSARLNRLNLTPLLIVVYALVIMYAVGYILVARGARKLKKIEEV